MKAKNTLEKWKEFLSIYNERVEKYIIKGKEFRKRKNDKFNQTAKVPEKKRKDALNKWRK